MTPNPAAVAVLRHILNEGNNAAMTEPLVELGFQGFTLGGRRTDGSFFLQDADDVQAVVGKASHTEATLSFSLSYCGISCRAHGDYRFTTSDDPAGVEVRTEEWLRAVRRLRYCARMLRAMPTSGVMPEDKAAE